MCPVLFTLMLLRPASSNHANSGLLPESLIEVGDDPGGRMSAVADLRTHAVVVYRRLDILLRSCLNDNQLNEIHHDLL